MYGLTVAGDKRWLLIPSGVSTVRLLELVGRTYDTAPADSYISRKQRKTVPKSMLAEKNKVYC